MEILEEQKDRQRIADPWKVGFYSALPILVLIVAILFFILLCSNWMRIALSTMALVDTIILLIVLFVPIVSASWRARLNKETIPYKEAFLICFTAIMLNFVFSYILCFLLNYFLLDIEGVLVYLPGSKPMAFPGLLWPTIFLQAIATSIVSVPGAFIVRKTDA